MSGRGRGGRRLLLRPPANDQDYVGDTAESTVPVGAADGFGVDAQVQQAECGADQQGGLPDKSSVVPSSFTQIMHRALYPFATTSHWVSFVTITYVISSSSSAFIVPVRILLSATATDRSLFILFATVILLHHKHGLCLVHHLRHNHVPGLMLILHHVDPNYHTGKTALTVCVNGAVKRT